MPCFRCGARQADPDDGPGQWRCAVRVGRQVLVCPDCQESGRWESDVDACPSCGSLALARRLGQTICTSCLAVLHHDFPPTDDWPAMDYALSRDVAAAIERTLGRA